MRHKKASYRHAILRAKERYKLEFDEESMDLLADFIATGLAGDFVSKSGEDCELWDVWIGVYPQQVQARVIYKPSEELVVTFLRPTPTFTRTGAGAKSYVYNPYRGGGGRNTATKVF